MSLAIFARGLNEGIPTGVRLGQAVNEGRNVKGVQDANELLAQMQELGPVPVTPSNTAVPEGGAEKAEDGIPVGYDGMEWDGWKRKYMKAMSKVSDPRTLIAMEERLAEVEKSKVLQYGRQAMAALEGGDVATAQQYFAGMSYFMNPGETPTVQMSEDGNLFVSDQDGETQVFRKEQIADMLHQFTDFNDWRQMTFDKKKHADHMAYRNATLAQQIKNDAQRLALEERRVLSAEGRNDMLNEQTMAQMEIAQSAAQRADEEYMITLSSAQREVFDELRKSASENFEKLLSDPSEIKGTPAGDVPIGMDETSSASELTTQYDEGAALDQAERRAYRSGLRGLYESFAPGRVFTQTLISGLAAGGDVATGEEIANLAFSYTFDSQGIVDYDPDSGTMVVGGARYRIGPAQAEVLNGLLGVTVGAQGPQQPTAQAIPEEVQ